jgi:SsrA-binding protein
MAAKSRKDKDKQGSAAVNKKAYRNFELIEKFEAGLELLGTEVKSLRDAQADLNGSYARVQNDECWLVGATIAQYRHTLTTKAWQK